MKHLLLLQYRIFRNRLLALSLLDEMKIALFAAFGLLFLGGIYFGAWRLLSYLNGVALIGPLLVNKLIALVFITSFSMVAFSSLITSFNTLFFSSDLHWLMATPLPVGKIFTFKAANTFVYSTWMVFLALLPFIAALGRVKEAGAGYYAAAFLLLAPFFGIAVMAGIVASLLLVKFFPSRKTRDFLLFLSVVAITGIYMLFRFIQPERLVKPDGLEVVSQYIAYLDAPTAVYMPSWWITAGIFGAVTGSLSEVLFYGALLSAACGLAYAGVKALAGRVYFTGWADSKVFGTGGKRPKESYRKRSLFGAFIDKDLRIFFRDAGQWSQLLVLGALVLVYVFSIYKLPLDTMYLQNLVSFFNVGLIGFILSAVALRFSFPLISLEGKNLWLIKSAPFPMTRLFWEKLAFGGIPLVITGALLAFVSSKLLNADPAMVWLLLASTLVMSAGLAFLSVSFGAVFPRFEITNIAQIESSSGGILYMVTSFFYLGLNIAILAVPVQAFYRAKFGGYSFGAGVYLWPLAVMLALNVVFAAVPAMYGLKKLRELEV